MAVANVLQPIIRFINPEMGRSTSSAKDVIDLAVSDELRGMEGHFVRRNTNESSPDSRVEKDQERIWRWSVELSGIGQEDTVLRL